jgi:hypothetical protein
LRGIALVFSFYFSLFFSRVLHCIALALAFAFAFEFLVWHDTCLYVPKHNIIFHFILLHLHYASIPRFSSGLAGIHYNL